MVLHQDFKELLILLNDNQVEYLVVGAFALGLYGAPRNTGDIDIWIETGEENAKKIVTAIDQFGFTSLQLDKQSFMEKDAVIQLGYPPVRIDIITSVSGLEFNEAYANRFTAEKDGIRIDFISKEDFIKNKKATGRLKDLADLERLLETEE